jgi:toluene monooxygenase electron transfer component
VHSLWPQAPGNRALRGAGDILLCQSAPASDCVIEAKPLVGELPDGLARAIPETYAGALSRVTPDGDGLAWVEIELDRPMSLLAGQFVLLSLPGIAGWRAYSPAQSGQAETRLTLLVRESPAGAMSPRLCTRASAGNRIDVLGPLGTAHVRPGADGDMAVVAGGSGAAVALSVVEWAAASRHLARHRIDLVCGLRSVRAQGVIERLSALALRWRENLAIVVAISDEPFDSSGMAPGIRFEQGMAHEVAARVPTVAAWRERAVFVAGPAPMVQASLRMLMKSARVSPTQVRYDSFT